MIWYYLQMIWLIVLAVPAWAVILVCFNTAAYRRIAARHLRRTQAKIEAAQTELATLQALTVEDRAWLKQVTWPKISRMTEPSSYAMPEIGSMWEWQPGNPMAREVIRVKETRGADQGSTGSIWVEGPSGDRIVSLADFAAGAVPATLRRHR